MSDPRQNPESQIPFSAKMEEALLGAVLVNPGAYYTVASRLRGEDDFFIIRHRHVWEAISTLARASLEFDYLMVAQVLTDSKKLEGVGGIPFLMRLINNTPTSVHAEGYAEFVRRLAVRRRLLSAADKIKDAAKNEDASLDQVVSQVEKHVFDALVDGTESRTTAIKSASSEYYDHVGTVLRGEREYLGIPTGFKDVDVITKGAQRGQLIYIAGRPGMGKTAFLLNIALHAARMNQRVFIWSGEMNVSENMARLIAADTAIDTQRLQLGQLDADELRRFTESSLERLPKLKLWIDDTAGITVNKLYSNLIRHSTIYGIDMVILDYIGLLRGAGRGNRTEEIGDISRNLKRMAMELNVPLYVASQLSRACESRNDKRPILSDLRDAGDLEQDANAVMFLYRDVVYNANTDNPNMGEVIIAKNRNGPTGTAYLNFNRPITRWENAITQPVSPNGRGSTYTPKDER